MGLLDNYTGIGMSPRPKRNHQLAMFTFARQSFAELRNQGLYPLTEMTVTDDTNDLAPDIVFFDQSNYPVSIIEITTHKELHRIIKKCYDLIVRFPDSEYFVYDYERLTLFQYDAQADTWLSSSEQDLFSRYLRLPVIDYFTPF